MFDLITGQARHLPRHQGMPILISMTAQVLVAAVLLAIPYLYVTEQLPEVSSMMAFVAAPPPPPPPPPSSPPPPARRAAKAARPAKPGQLTAPIAAPTSVTPEPVATAGDEEGFVGGIEGGVPGGVFGGVVGGIPDVTPPPPPPPPPAQPPGPVRIGGQLHAPELVRRVNPEYPPMAALAHIQGLVILEAVVGDDGHVNEVRLLRSAGYGGVLDRAAVAALRQWQYAPLLLNGHPTAFILTVTLSFSLTDKE